MTNGIDFDRLVTRSGTGSYKWDSRKNVLPLWVADMDFPAAPCILDALQKRLDHGVFGYTLVGDKYYQALTGWFSSRHHYSFSREDVIVVPGIVPAISAIIKALVPEGKGVIVQTPVYNCFFSSIRNNGCRVVENPLIRTDISAHEFTYKMDFEGLERLAADSDNVIMLLCNPHNPAGRVWTREELQQVREICRRNGVVVVSDEIHNELTMPGVDYVAYGTLDPEAVVCVSPSKSFNIAGLQIANIVAPDAEQHALINRAVNINEVCDVNPFGVTALIAAYSQEGAEWIEALREYLRGNYLMLCEYLSEHLPKSSVARLEGTYLPWIDTSAYGASDEIEHRLIEEARVWVNSGVMYGKDGYIRVNIACQRVLLEDGLARMCSVLTGKNI